MEKRYLSLLLIVFALFFCDGNVFSSFEIKNTEEALSEELVIQSNQTDSVSVSKRSITIEKKVDLIEPNLIENLEDVFGSTHVENLLSTCENAQQVLGEGNELVDCVAEVNRNLLDSVGKDSTLIDFKNSEQVEEYVDLLEDLADISASNIVSSLDSLNSILNDPVVVAPVDTGSLVVNAPSEVNVLERFAKVIIKDSQGNTTEAELSENVIKISQTLKLYEQIPKSLSSIDIQRKRANFQILRSVLNIGLIMIEDLSVMNFNFATDSLQSYYSNGKTPFFRSPQQVNRNQFISDDVASVRSNVDNLSSSAKEDFIDFDNDIDLDSNLVLSSEEFEQYVSNLIQ